MQNTFDAQDRKKAVQLFIDHKDNIKEIEGLLTVTQENSFTERAGQKCLTPLQMKEAPYFFSQHPNCSYCLNINLFGFVCFWSC
jgi:hypothetical protein